MKRSIIFYSMAVASSALVMAPPATAEAPTAQPSQQAQAPSAERLELARRFLAVSMPGDYMFDQMRGEYYFEAALDEIEDARERAEAKRHMDRLAARIDPHLRKAMPDILERYAQAYAREFPAEELRQLIAFAESPAGKRYSQRAGALASDPKLMEAEAKLWETLEPVMEEFQKEACAEKAAQRFAAGDTKAKCPLAEAETRSG